MKKSQVTDKVIGEVRHIPSSDIRPFPSQPRTFFDPIKLEELADSIATIGQQIPIIVREIPSETPDPKGRRYELIEGQRRWHACVMRNITYLKAEVRVIKDEDEQYEMSVVANFQREGHTIPETVRAIKHFADKGKSVKQICAIFGKSNTWVYQHLSLLDKLNAEVFKLLDPTTPEEKRINFNIALALLDAPKDQQPILASSIASLGLSIGKARLLIEKSVHANKARSIYKPKRGKAYKFRLIAGVFRRTREQLEIVLDRPQSMFDEAITLTPSGLIVDTLIEMEKARTNLEQCIEIVRKSALKCGKIQPPTEETPALTASTK